MAKQLVDTPERERSEQAYRSVAVSSGGAAARNNLRNIGLIIRREYKNIVTRRSFLITSIILIMVVFLAAFIPTIVQLITARTASQTHIVVVNEAGSVAGLSGTALTSYINSELNGTNTGSRAPYAISSQSSANVSSLQSQVKQGKLDSLLVLDRAPNQDLRFTYDTNASATDDPNLPNIQSLTQLLTFLDTAYRLGLTATQTQRLAAPPDLTVVHAQQSQNTQPAGEMVAEYVLAIAGAVLIYVFVGVYCGIVAAGVAEEKGSRIMEILVNAATPFQLLAGKIVGIGAACMTQMACVVGVGITALLLQGPLQAALFGTSAGGLSLHLTGVSIPFYLIFLVYILLAFFLYATLYAGLGAMVKRQDEVQGATILPSLLVLSGYLLVYLVVSSPDATWAKVLSYIPFWTPTLMLVRIAVGTVAWWEIVVTIALMLLAILGCTWFAARLYRLGVLMYGQRPGLGQLVKLVRMS